MQNSRSIILPAEWRPQSGVQLTWPHEKTDWADMLDEVTGCFAQIAREIAKREKLLIVCRNQETVKASLALTDLSNIIFREMETNDTWARDHGGITVLVNENPFICDFTFNGWGLKFAANHDNQITKKLYQSGVFSPETGYQSMKHCVLEGGSIESDGCGTLLTTEQCLLSPNRNDYKCKAEIEDYLQMMLGAERMLWLSHGYLRGDDTDSHIDTLARFCDKNTIAYVQCTDPDDEHYAALALMEKELKSFTTLEGKPYRLIALPMAGAVWSEGERLPATYANFLIINGAVLIPFYDSPKDILAKQLLQEAFPDREMIGINCLPLIKQHGSLHCVTMQYPESVL